MQFIDTHTHLYLDSFKEEIDQVLKRSFDSNVDRLILPAIDKNTYDSMMELSLRSPEQIFPMIGLHPCSVKENYEEELDFVYGELSHNPERFVAVGEIGIDLYWDQSTLAIQQTAFRKQIEWAKEFNKPIAIHTRNSFNEVFDILEEMNDDKLTGVFHCFTGGKRQVKRALDLGFKLGIGGIITFDQGLPNVIKKVGIEHLLLETDAPFLAPVPHKGEQNESSYIPLIAKKIAEIKELTLNDVANITTQNAMDLFKLKS